jgi:hypothetical protein
MARRGLLHVSRRDKRTEPGVLTPGADPAPRTRPERAAHNSFEILFHSVAQRLAPSPLQGGLSLHRPLGLKPQAESCNPFGTNSDCPYGTKSRPPTYLPTRRHFLRLFFRSSTAFLRINSIWPFTLRRSSCAHASKSRQSFSSIRSKNGFRSAIGLQW